MEQHHFLPPACNWDACCGHRWYSGLLRHLLIEHNGRSTWTWSMESMMMMTLPWCRAESFSSQCGNSSRSLAGSRVSAETAQKCCISCGVTRWHHMQSKSPDSMIAESAFHPHCAHQRWLLTVVVSSASACVRACVRVYMCASACEGQRVMLGVLSGFSTLSFQTGSPTEPGVHWLASLVARKFHGTSYLRLPPLAMVRNMHAAMPECLAANSGFYVHASTSRLGHLRSL